MKPLKKEPWEMTGKEMAQAVIDGEYDFPTLGGDHHPASKEAWTIKDPNMSNYDIAKKQWDEMISREHEAVVTIAVIEGNPVSLNVLKCYPELEKYCEIAAKRCSQGVFDFSTSNNEVIT